MLLVVGHIARAHGVRGEVVVDLRTDSPDQRFTAGAVLLTDPVSAGPLTVVAVRPHQGRLLVSFDGLGDRDAADALRGVLLCADSGELARSDDPDEFADHQLVGLMACGTDGEHLGEVRRVEHAPASDLLVLSRPDGREVLVPFVRAIVPEVDLAGGRLVVTPPDGLLDL